MWRYSTLVVPSLHTTGLFAATLIPSQGIPLLPGLPELRPANVISLVGAACFLDLPESEGSFREPPPDIFGTMAPGSFFNFIPIEHQT